MFGFKENKEPWRGGVYLTTVDSTMTADILISKLAAEGIPCMKRHEGASNFLELYMGMSTVFPVELYVPEESLKLAEEIIRPVPIEDDYDEISEEELAALAEAGDLEAAEAALRNEAKAGNTAGERAPGNAVNAAGEGSPGNVVNAAGEGAPGNTANVAGEGAPGGDECEEQSEPSETGDAETVINSELPSDDEESTGASQEQSEEESSAGAGTDSESEFELSSGADSETDEPAVEVPESEDEEKQSRSDSEVPEDSERPADTAASEDQEIQSDSEEAEAAFGASDDNTFGLSDDDMEEPKAAYGLSENGGKETETGSETPAVEQKLSAAESEEPKQQARTIPDDMDPKRFVLNGGVFIDDEDRECR